MEKILKPLSIVLGALALLLLIMSLSLFVSLSRVKNEKTTLQTELAQVMKERKKISLALEELEVIKKDLDIKVNELQTETALLSENLEEQKRKSASAEREAQEKEKQLVAARERLQKAREEKEELERQVVREQERYTQLKSRIDKLIDVKNTLDKKVRDIINKQGVELERIVVHSAGQLEGRILVVNRDYNFVVVDIGERDEVGEGTVLTLFHDGAYAGEAEIDKVYDTMSSATIIKEATRGLIEVGDSVVVRREP